MLISIIIHWFGYQIGKWLRDSSIISVDLLQRSQINHIMKSKYVFATFEDSKQRTYSCIIVTTLASIENYV